MEEKLRRILLEEIWASGADMYSKMNNYDKSIKWMLSFPLRDTEISDTETAFPIIG